MLKIGLKKLNDFIQPLGYTVAIVRDDKDDENGPYHSIWIGENDEFVKSTSQAPAELDPAPQPEPQTARGKGKGV